MSPRTALIVVDVQNDFCEGGSLAVQGGAAVAAGITAHLAEHRDRYALVVASLDWHQAGSANGGHIALPPAVPDYVDSWPVHCIAGTPGAEHHPALDTSALQRLVRKGYGAPSYSAFEAVDDELRDLRRVLADERIEAVQVVGLATDYCVRATALSARGFALPTTVLLGLCAAVRPDGVGATVDELVAAGCAVLDR